MDKSKFYVEKEKVAEMVFPEKEVLQDEAKTAERVMNAEKAAKLGNLFKDKVKIVFEDSEGIKFLQTTIWGVRDGKVMLKRGLSIPLHRIYEIII